MATVVSVLDRSDWQARTDNIVLVDPARERLLWVPRDLWCERIHNRIGRAFGLGGHAELLAVLADWGLPAEHSVCLQRAAVEQALEDLEVAVPVPSVLEFWYPLAPEEPIEEGRKLVRFSPPTELLSGERLHQWIGARISTNRSSSDLDRIKRQQVLVRCLMRDGFDFERALADPALVSLSDPLALTELRQVRPAWKLRTYGPVETGRVGSMMVLVSRPRWWRRAARAARPASLQRRLRRRRRRARQDDR